MNRETPGEKTIRLGKEAKIKDYFNAHDMIKVNEQLDFYPHNKERPDISLEMARHIIRISNLPQLQEAA